MLDYLSEDTGTDEEDVGLSREESFRIWALCEALEWKHLPFPGCLLEQPDWFIEDVLTISRRKKLLDDAPNVNETEDARRLGQ